MANTMTTMNISLPEAMRKYVEEQVKAGGYSTASEYFRELVRAEARRRDQERLEKLLLEGLDSGPAIEVTPEYWRRKKQDLIKRAEALKAERSSR